MKKTLIRKIYDALSIFETAAERLIVRILRKK